MRAARQAETNNEGRRHGARAEDPKYGVSFGSALSIAVSYGNDRSLSWTIVEGLLGSIYVIYFAIFSRSRDDASRLFRST
jgi:hypothetical protein